MCFLWKDGDAHEVEVVDYHGQNRPRALQGGAWGRIEGDAHPSPAEPIPFLGCPDCED